MASVFPRKEAKLRIAPSGHEETPIHWRKGSRVHSALVMFIKGIQQALCAIVPKFHKTIPACRNHLQDVMQMLLMQDDKCHHLFGNKSRGFNV